MVVHHLRLREPNWRSGTVINAVGCVATGIVALVVVVSKFTEGAFISVITVMIPEFVTQWKTQWLHNQSAFALKARLLYRPNTVVTSVPVLVGDVIE